MPIHEDYTFFLLNLRLAAITVNFGDVGRPRVLVDSRWRQVCEEGAVIR